MAGCKMCGECCKWVYFQTGGLRSVLTEIDKLRGIEYVDDHTIRIPCSCKHLDPTTNKCAIWHSRPGICRLYPDRCDKSKYPTVKGCTYED